MNDYQALIQAMSAVLCTWSQLILVTLRQKRLLWGHKGLSTVRAWIAALLAPDHHVASFWPPFLAQGGPKNNPGTLISSASFPKVTKAVQTMSWLFKVALLAHWHQGKLHQQQLRSPKQSTSWAKEYAGYCLGNPRSLWRTPKSKLCIFPDYLCSFPQYGRELRGKIITISLTHLGVFTFVFNTFWYMHPAFCSEYMAQSYKIVFLRGYFSSQDKSFLS